MASTPLSMDDSLSEADQDDGRERLSQNGQMIGIAVYGGLVLVGFFFGVVTGYESPKPPVVIVKKETETPKPEATKPEPPKPTPQITPEPTPEPKKIDPPTPEPKKVDPPTPEPKKVDPPVPEPKKEIIPELVFKDVFPVLRKHCTDCHGAGKAQGGVDVTTIAKIMTSKSKETMLTPGMPDKSRLYTTIIDGEMPKDNKTKLSDKELMLLRDWIRGGARE
jgi:hypothetical protein